jgi:hypothetical protein
MTLEEQDAMIASLKSASKSTAFEQWLGAVRGPASAPGPGGGSNGGSPPGAAVGGGGAAAAASASALSHQEEMAATLAEVAEYLRKEGIAGRAPADPASLAADNSSFK